MVPEEMSTAESPIEEPLDRKLPSRWEAARFLGKTRVFQLRRLMVNLSSGEGRRLRQTAKESWSLAAESRSPLFRKVSDAERQLEEGKVHNLRLAARFVDGALLPKEKMFSFWAQIGRPVARRGFVEGRELREGCIIPSIGGGLCQLSNALYDVALKAGFDILERHAHSRIVPGSMAEAGRDATVFWNYVDLRFRGDGDCQLGVDFEENEMVVRLFSREPIVPCEGIPGGTDVTPDRLAESGAAGSCENCGETSCFRNRG